VVVEGGGKRLLWWFWWRLKVKIDEEWRWLKVVRELVRVVIELVREEEWWRNNWLGWWKWERRVSYGGGEVVTWEKRERKENELFLWFLCKWMNVCDFDLDLWLI
jgi:hypothetical protein